MTADKIKVNVKITTISNINYLLSQHLRNDAKTTVIERRYLIGRAGWLPSATVSSMTGRRQASGRLFQTEGQCHRFCCFDRNWKTMVYRHSVQNLAVLRKQKPGSSFLVSSRCLLCIRTISSDFMQIVETIGAQQQKLPHFGFRRKF